MTSTIVKVYACTAAGARPLLAQAVFLDDRPPFWCVRHGQVGLGAWQLRVPITDPSAPEIRLRAQRWHLPSEATWRLTALPTPLSAAGAASAVNVYLERSTKPAAGALLFIDPEPAPGVEVLFTTSGRAKWLAAGKMVYAFGDTPMSYHAPVALLREPGDTVTWVYKDMSFASSVCGLTYECRSDYTIEATALSEVDRSFWRDATPFVAPPATKWLEELGDA
jgi:hypothetical protein